MPVTSAIVRVRIRRLPLRRRKLSPHCGESSDPFGSGGAEASAAKLGIAFLGRIPLSVSLREASDAGTPPAAGEGPAAEAFAELARRLLEQLETIGD